MKCKILHESRGRIRVHLMQAKMSFQQADIVEEYIRLIPAVTDVKVFDRTQDVVIYYSGDRQNIIKALADFSYENSNIIPPEHTGRALSREYEDKLVCTVLQRCVAKLFIPSIIRNAIALIKASRYIFNGIKALWQGRVDVSVLDAIAIAISVLRGDVQTASSIMFMLNIGDTLEEWTHKKSVDDLARTMSLNVNNVWLKRGEQEILTPVSEIEIGDYIVVRTGNMIALDGKVVSGEATVNQASITGESLPVRKESGSYAYAGTAVEEGECVICVEKISGSGRYDRIVRMIEESEKLKSNTESKASNLADKLVPYTLGAAALCYLLTKNATKALSILMVDFSCALKLAMPITVLSAMRECNLHNISVKGGKYLEAIAQADTIVFDKTGTLTHANPTVADVVAFGGRNAREMLRLAACLEEHYPHSMANAVVLEAKNQGLNHDECHTSVEYVVAHGISSMVDGEKVVIGSYHFVFEDECAVVLAEDQQRFDSLPEEYSHLYLAISGELAAVICIEDPLRSEASDVITALRGLGVKNIIMMTGDNKKTARAVAAAVGINHYYSEVLPEDKATFVRQERLAGRKVVMLGDGINDSPALSEADVGIAISDGAAIAREIADITISSEDLFSLVTLRIISQLLMKRISGNYNFIIAFNAMLIALGVTGVIMPTASALLHNASTLGVSLKSMTNLLE